MQKDNITKLALKLAGLYILVKVILNIPAIVSSIKILKFNNELQVESITLWITFTLLVVLGLWLTFRNNPKFEKEKTVSSELITVGLAISGVVIFTLAISNLPLLISNLVYISGHPMQIDVFGTNSVLDNIMILAGSLIQLILGTLLFFKAKYFARLIK